MYAGGSNSREGGAEVGEAEYGSAPRPGPKSWGASGADGALHTFGEVGCTPARASWRRAGTRGSDVAAGMRASDVGAGMRASDVAAGMRASDVGAGMRASDVGAGLRGSINCVGTRGSDGGADTRGARELAARACRPVGSSSSLALGISLVRSAHGFWTCGGTALRRPPTCWWLSA
jgi:hypothetical protein